MKKQKPSGYNLNKKNIFSNSRRQFLFNSSILSASVAFACYSPWANAISNVINKEIDRLIYNNPLNFNGERRDPLTGHYNLGNGYRIYNPKLMRFHQQDSLSPFGEGGLNPYGFSLNNPINMVDPSGHLSWQAWLTIGLGVAGLILSGLTFGMGIAGLMVMMAAGGASAFLIGSSALGITSSVFGIASAATSIASGALEEINPEASVKLGWASLGTGIASLLTGLVNYGVFKGVMAPRVQQFSSTVEHIPFIRNGAKLGALEVMGNRVRSHGFPFNTVVKYNGSIAANGTHVGQMTGPILENVAQIRYNVCFGAFGGKLSSAQLVANQTGRTVRAATGFTVAAKNGIDLTRTFTPMSGLSKTLTNSGGALLSHFSRAAMYNSAISYRAHFLFNSQAMR